MKLHGKKIEGAYVETVVFPRTNGERLVFRAQAVLDMEEFDRILPRPKPPKMRKKGGLIVEDDKNPDYIETLNSYGRSRLAFMVLKSLQATDGLEWETVDMSRPDTWSNYEAELKSSGLVDAEINKLFSAVLTANALNDAKLDEARNDFLASQSEESPPDSSQKDGQPSTEPGAPASA